MGASPNIPPIDLGSFFDSLTGSPSSPSPGAYNVPIPPYLSNTPSLSGLGAGVSGNSSATATANPTIIIEEGSKSIETYALIGLGLIAIIGLVMLGRRGSHGGGGHKQQHHSHRSK